MPSPHLKKLKAESMPDHDLEDKIADLTTVGVFYRRCYEIAKHVTDNSNADKDEASNQLDAFILKMQDVVDTGVKALNS